MTEQKHTCKHSYLEYPLIIAETGLHSFIFTDSYVGKREKRVEIRQI